MFLLQREALALAGIMEPALLKLLETGDSTA